jgi:hypothetical protein
MTCGCHVQHGMLPRHYDVLHPDSVNPGPSGDVTTGALDE